MTDYPKLVKALERILRVTIDSREPGVPTSFEKTAWALANEALPLARQLTEERDELARRNEHLEAVFIGSAPNPKQDAVTLGQYVDLREENERLTALHRKTLNVSIEKDMVIDDLQSRLSEAGVALRRIAALRAYDHDRRIPSETTAGAMARIARETLGWEDK